MGGQHKHECDWGNKGGHILQPHEAIQDLGSRQGGEWLQALGWPAHVQNTDKRAWECVPYVPWWGQPFQ